MNFFLNYYKLTADDLSPHWDADEDQDWEDGEDLNNDGVYQLSEYYGDDIGIDGVGPGVKSPKFFNEKLFSFWSDFEVSAAYYDFKRGPHCLICVRMFWRGAFIDFASVAILALSFLA